jgi:uncharacterized protein (TIGR02246 family)
MRISLRQGLAFGLLGVGVLAGVVYGVQAPAAAPAAKAAPDEADIRKVLTAFVDAFNNADAKALAAALSPTAEFIDESSNRIEGAAAIGEILGKFFAENKGAKLQVTPEGLRSIAPGVAVEDGESVITVPEKKTQSVRKVTVVYAKVEGAWKLASIREYPEEPEVLTAEERLKELDWFLGDWIDEGGNAVVHNSVRLSPDKTHMVREFAVKREGQDVLKGMQWIGVDPLTGTIKAWSFDGDGGRSESTWTKSGSEWLVRSTGVTSDGDESGATYLFKPVSKDRIELKVMHKVVGNAVEADAAVVLVRQAATPRK